MEVSSTTTTVKLPEKTHVHVKLQNYKDPHVLSLEDTYSTAQYVPELIAIRKTFLGRLETAKIDLRTLPPCTDTPLIPKLWRASVPPSIDECSLLEREVLASMVRAAKRWCIDQARRRKEMHEHWVQSALEYFVQVRELHVSEGLLVTFIVKEMNGGKLLKQVPPYEQAATQYAQWLIQPPEKSPDVVERSKKYARAAASHSERASRVRMLKDGLESPTLEAPPLIPEPADKLSTAAKRCVRWVQTTANMWVADLFEHEDSLHIKRLNCAVDALPSRSV